MIQGFSWKYIKNGTFIYYKISNTEKIKQHNIRIGVLVNQSFFFFLGKLFNTDADGSCKVDEQAVCQLRDLEFFNIPNCSIYIVQYCILKYCHHKIIMYNKSCRIYCVVQLLSYLLGYLIYCFPQYLHAK